MINKIKDMLGERSGRERTGVPRNVIVHFHYYKNAGSSVRYILMRNFHGKYLDFILPVSRTMITGKEAIKIILDNPGVEAVTSHEMIYPFPPDERLRIYPLIFIRNPIDRIGSIYRYERISGERYERAEIARTECFKGYIEWIFSKKERMGEFSEFHVRELSCRGDGELHDFKERCISGSDLSIAYERLEGLKFFGIVERFSESIKLMEGYLDGAFPGIDYRYQHQNRTERIDPFETRIGMLRQELGSSLFDRLEKVNRLDLELYNHACELFEARVKEKIG